MILTLASGSGLPIAGLLNRSKYSYESHPICYSLVYPGVGRTGAGALSEADGEPRRRPHPCRPRPGKADPATDSDGREAGGRRSLGQDPNGNHCRGRLADRRRLSVSGVGSKPEARKLTAPARSTPTLLLPVV